MVGRQDSSARKLSLYLVPQTVTASPWHLRPASVARARFCTRSPASPLPSPHSQAGSLGPPRGSRRGPRKASQMWLPRGQSQIALTAAVASGPHSPAPPALLSPRHSGAWRGPLPACSPHPHTWLPVPPSAPPSVLSAVRAHGRPSPSPLGLFCARRHTSLLEGQLCEGRTSVWREPDTQEAQGIRNVCHL